MTTIKEVQMTVFRNDVRLRVLDNMEVTYIVHADELRRLLIGKKIADTRQATRYPHITAIC